MLNYNDTVDLKIDLLSYGISFETGIFNKVKTPYYDNQYVYGQPSENITLGERLPQVILLGNGVNCAILKRSNSKYKIRRYKDTFGIYIEDMFITDIGLPERPAYFDKPLSDGSLSQNVISVAGESTPGYFLYPNCLYFVQGYPCSFCSLKSTRKEYGTHLINRFSDSHFKESVKLIEDTNWGNNDVYFITTGTCDEKSYYDEIIRPIQIVYDAMTRKKKIHLLTHPPKDMALLQELKNSGVTTISFNLEVYNRNRFDTICGGKSSYYGYDKWIDALFQARDIWGEYKVFCGLIWGLESTDDTISGNHFFAQNGISVTSNIFHADPKSILHNYPHPTSNEIKVIARDLSELYRTYLNMPSLFDVSMRGTVDWEVKNGYKA